MWILIAIKIVIYVMYRNEINNFIIETTSNAAIFLFTALSYICVGLLIFGLCYLILNRVGLNLVSDKVSLIVAALGAIYVFHKSEDY